MCNQPSLDTVCDRAERPLHSRARGHESLLDLTGTACRPCSAPEMRSRMRLPSCAPSFCSSKPVWLPRIITSCPKTAKAPPRLHATRAPRSTGQTFPGAFDQRCRPAAEPRAPGPCSAPGTPRSSLHTAPARAHRAERPLRPPLYLGADVNTLPMTLPSHYTGTK
jgi:hypothetical protein